MSMGTLPRGVWDAMDAHERTMPRDVESWEMISAVSAPAEVGEGSWPLDSWPVEGPYGQSGDLLWRGGGDIPWTVAKQCYLFAASRELPDGQWRQPRIVWTQEAWSGWVEQRLTVKGSV